LRYSRRHRSSYEEAEGRRQKAEGRRQKGKGRGQKAEGRRQKAEGKRLTGKGFSIWLYPNRLGDCYIFGISRIATVEAQDKLCGEGTDDAGFGEVLPGV
jgi:hypothetical protein